jgi:phosphate starvation-inducible PhoH-like protein
MKKSIGISPNIETLFGTRDENVRVLEDGLNVTIDLRSNAIELEGAARDVARAEQVFADYESLQRSGYSFNNGDLNSMLRVLTADSTATLRGLADAGRQRSLGRRMVQPKSVNQRRYVEAIEKHDMVFGVGPAGTGKTYLAVAMAISALLAKRVNRIILARPAVEAGERLGFLPGTLQDKIDPYLRPLYDALYDMLDPEKVDRYLEKNVIEIAPIAFMRGRTLNDSFVILDEAQNTTSEQMKMFVTRLGFNSKAVITGDITQIDLPNARRSGLLEAIDILKRVEGLTFVHFDESDVVRHHLVQRIIRAYDEHEHMSRSSRCCCWLGAKTPTPGTRRQRTQTTRDPEKLRENRVCSRREGRNRALLFILLLFARNNTGSTLVILRKRIAGLSRSTLERFVLRARRAVRLRNTGECAGYKQRRVAISQPAVSGSRQAHRRTVVSSAARRNRRLQTGRR